mgnify:CR=1 FL=1
MKVFHGSAIEVKIPEIRTGKFTKDFGEGFWRNSNTRHIRYALLLKHPSNA